MVRNKKRERKKECWQTSVNERAARGYQYHFGQEGATSGPRRPVFKLSIGIFELNLARETHITESENSVPPLLLISDLSIESKC